MYDLIKDKFPLSCEAYEDFIESAHTASRMEINLLKRIIDKKNQRNMPSDYDENQPEIEVDESSEG